MTIWIAAAAVGAGLVFAALVWVVKRSRRGSINDGEAAAQAASASLPGFVSHGAIIGDDGAAALVIAQDGRMALITRYGNRIRSREVAANMLVAGIGGVEVQFAGWRTRKAYLAGVDALDVRRLMPSAV